MQVQGNGPHYSFVEKDFVGVQNQQQQDVFNWIPPANQFSPNWEQPVAQEQFAPNWGQQPLLGGTINFMTKNFQILGPHEILFHRTIMRAISLDLRLKALLMLLGEGVDHLPLTP